MRGHLILLVALLASCAGWYAFVTTPPEPPKAVVAAKEAEVIENMSLQTGKPYVPSGVSTLDPLLFPKGTAETPDNADDILPPLPTPSFKTDSGTGIKNLLATPAPSPPHPELLPR